MSTAMQYSYSDEGAAARELQEILSAMDGRVKEVQRLSAGIAAEVSPGRWSVRRKVATSQVLEPIAAARDFMRGLLEYENYENGSDARPVLHALFDDCRNVAQVHATLDLVAELLARSHLVKDQRLAGCLKACNALEGVLQDSGLSERLSKAKEDAREEMIAVLTPFRKQAIAGPQFVASPALLFDNIDSAEAIADVPSSQNVELQESKLEVDLPELDCVIAPLENKQTLTSDVAARSTELLLEVNTCILDPFSEDKALEQNTTIKEAELQEALDAGTLEKNVVMADPVTPETTFEQEPACEQTPEEKALASPCCQQSIVPELELGLCEEADCDADLAHSLPDKENTPLAANAKGSPSLSKSVALDDYCIEFQPEQLKSPSKKHEKDRGPLLAEESFEPMREPSPEPDISKLTCVEKLSNGADASLAMPCPGQSNAEIAKLCLEQSSAKLAKLCLEQTSAEIQKRSPRGDAAQFSKRPSTSKRRHTITSIESTQIRRPTPSPARARSHSFSGVSRKYDRRRENEEKCILKENTQQRDRVHSSSTAFQAISPSHQSLIRQLFAHYVGPSGMSSGTGLSLSKFRRFLRDCGLLSKELDEAVIEPAQADLTLARAADTGCRGVVPRLRTAEAFAQALIDVAVYSSPELSAMPDQALEVLCDAVLVPLGAAVLPGVTHDVQVASSALADRDVAALLRRCQQGLSALFARYASGARGPDPYRRGHWTARDVSRFAADAGIVADLSHALLQQLFCACASFEANHSRGEDDKVSFACFLLALVATSQRIYATQRKSPHQALARMLRRISVQIPGHHDIVSASREALRCG